MKYLYRAGWLFTTVMFMFAIARCESKLPREQAEDTEGTTYYVSTAFGPVVCKKAERPPCGMRLSDCGSVAGQPFPNLVISCAHNVGSEK